MKKKNSSQVWDFFTKLDSTIARCNFCGTQNSFKTTTSNLRKHLLRKHHIKLLQGKFPVKDQNESGNPEHTEVMEEWRVWSAYEVPSNESETQNEEKRGFLSITEATTSDLGSISQEKQMPFEISRYITKNVDAIEKSEVDRQLLKIFTKDLQPLSLLDNAEFKKFINSLNENYELPSRHSVVSNLLPSFYLECYNLAAGVVKKVNSASISIECWSVRNNENFLSVTAHFVSSFHFQSIFLDCAPLDGCYNSKNIADLLRKILKQWGLLNKVYVAVTEDSTEIRKAIEEELGIKHVKCFALTLNLIILNSLAPATVLLTKIRSVVHYFKINPVASEKFHNLRNHEGRIPKKLVLDKLGNWVSTFQMLERFSEMSEFVQLYECLDSKEEFKNMKLTNDEWACVQELVEVLGPFESATRCISEGGGYPPASLVIVLANGMQHVIGRLREKELQPVVKEVVKSLEVELSQHLGRVETDPSLSSTTFLDPRFKSVAHLDSEAVNATKKRIMEEIAQREREEGKSKVSEQMENNNRISLWDSFDSVIACSEGKDDPNSKAKAELDRYIDVPFLPRSGDPFNWWSANHNNFPCLANIFSDYGLSIASSVPPARLFTKSGSEFIDRRSRLSPSKVKVILFLNANQYLMQ